MSIRTCIAITISIFAALALILGCSEDALFGPGELNRTPTIKLTSGPIEGDTTQYRVTFYWLGSDWDGCVAYYEFVMVPGDPIGFDPADTAGVGKWTKTILTDSTFSVKADEYDSTVTISNNLYARYSKVHTFFVRAVDDRGKRSVPEHRSFTAFTLAPYAIIEYPVSLGNGQAQFLNPIVTFKWSGKDPIDSPWNYRDVDSVRYMVDFYTLHTILDLNQDPEIYESSWSPWIWYHQPDDSGKQTIIGDDELLRANRIYFFAVQAKDEAGAVTSIFDYRTNVFPFMPLEHEGPKLTVTAEYFGRFDFMGTNYAPAKIKTMAGFPLKFSWIGDASQYGGYISTYRYGWDIEELNNPDDWDTYASPYCKSSPVAKFFMGYHTLYIETVDNFGTVTLGQIEVAIFPVAMDRNLLWVDDFASGEFTQKIYALPTESEHDEFWLDICSRADDFYPDRDVFDCQSSAFVPELEMLFRYKNIIWTYSSEYRTLVWDDVVKYTSESAVGADMNITFNFLLTYMKSGGHLWSLGLSYRSSGLAAVVPTSTKEFPKNLRCELFGTTMGCTDTTGLRCMAYRDYCVDVLDKAQAVFRRDDPFLPLRNVDRDAMSYAYLDPSDPITASHPSFPEKLELWEEVTKPLRYFDPQEKGFHYIEIYNPEYWMAHSYARVRPCFHPIYRMRARNTFSCVDDCIVAFWTTKYADVVAEAPNTIAAPSVQFGLPLWFFNREQANGIADAIFEEWHIKSMLPPEMKDSEPVR